MSTLNLEERQLAFLLYDELDEEDLILLQTHRMNRFLLYKLRPSFFFGGRTTRKPPISVPSVCLALGSLGYIIILYIQLAQIKHDH